MPPKTLAQPKVPLPAGTVTFLFSDIEQSTERWERHRDAMSAALKRHDAAVRREIKRHGGVVFKTVGDAFCAAFTRPESAVAAALDIQRAMREQDWSAVGGLRVRIGLHTGTAHIRGGDYFGPTVNRVARVLALAHGGQVLASDVVAQLAQSHVSEGVDFIDLGAHRLRGVSRPERLHQITANDLPSEFPPLASSEAPPNNLPAQLTPFIGRDEELAHIRSLLNDHRLVTVLGAGGIGKTRAALEAASSLIAAFPDGAWFVDLASIHEPKLVVSAIAQALGVVDTGSLPLIDSIVRSCKSKRMLLIFDNCEQVSEAVGETAQRLLGDCAAITILATSREPLCIEAECKYRMPSMSLADGLALFEMKAQSSGAQFALSEENKLQVEEIIRRVDGIALAIEIVASQLSHFGLSGLATHLERCLNMPASVNRGKVPRQQTMRALIDWSYGLLSRGERRLFRQLAVFRGGMTLDAVLNVCVVDSGDVLALLAALVDKSLLVPDADDQPRYRVLEPTREYAIEQLESAHEREATIARHCRYYACASAKAYDDTFKMNLRTWIEQTLRDLQNYRAAIDWGLLQRNDVESGAQIVSNLVHLWWEWLENEGRGLVQDALRAVEGSGSQRLHAELVIASATLDRLSAEPEPCAKAVSVLKQSGSRVRYADALNIYARNALGTRGWGSQAVQYLEESLSISRDLGCLRMSAATLRYLSYWYHRLGQIQKATAALEEAVLIVRRYNDKWRMVDTLVALAETRFYDNDVSAAIECLREALSVADEIGYQSDGQMPANMAAYLLESGDFAGAWKCARESLDLALLFEARMPLIFALQHLACISAIIGNIERAAYIIGYVDGTLSAAEGVRELTEEKGYKKLMELLRGGLDAQHLSETLAEGARAAQSAVVAQALLIPEPEYTPK